MAKDEVRRYQENLRDELDGAALYARIAAAESDAARKELFLQLSQEEARHAAFWRQKAREELGLDPKELGGNPLSAAATSFGLFSIGAVLPVAAFLWTRGTLAVALSVAISAAGLFAIGLLTSLFNGRGPWFSALRQTLFGCAAAAVTYGIGSALGVTLS